MDWRLFLFGRKPVRCFLLELPAETLVLFFKLELQALVHNNKLIYSQWHIKCGQEFVWLWKTINAGNTHCGLQTECLFVFRDKIMTSNTVLDQDIYELVMWPNWSGISTISDIRQWNILICLTYTDDCVETTANCAINHPKMSASCIVYYHYLLTAHMNNNPFSLQ